MFEHLKASLIDDFLGGRIDIVFPEIVASMKNTLRRVLSQKIIDTKTFKTIRSFELNSRQTIMILSGLLRFEVLKLMLMKRCRVNYGPVQSCNWAPIIQSRLGIVQSKSGRNAAYVVHIIQTFEIRRAITFYSMKIR